MRSARIPLAILKLIRVCDAQLQTGAQYLLVAELTRSSGHAANHNSDTERAATAGAIAVEFLTYQLSTAEYGSTVALTGDGELGFDSGEGARETATTSKEGSRRANYPILKQGGSDKE